MILGLGVVFELPILVFFLALMGVVSAGWMWRNVRYSILVIFIIAAIITPTTRHSEYVHFCRAHGRALFVEHRNRLYWCIQNSERRGRNERDDEALQDYRS